MTSSRLASDEPQRGGASVSAAALQIRPAFPWSRLLRLALAYFAVAQLSLAFAIPPGYAAPLWPAAGLALVAGNILEASRPREFCPMTRHQREFFGLPRSGPRRDQEDGSESAKGFLVMAVATSGMSRAATAQRLREQQSGSTGPVAGSEGERHRTRPW